MAAKTYGREIPHLPLESLKGKLLVIEGADGSGRTTQIEPLRAWLESRGYAVDVVGLRRSNLVSEELNEAKKDLILGLHTLTLFYATDFADQLENKIIPALRAGFIVLADRYIYTLMARAVVRGADRKWLESLYSVALVPDAVFYLSVEPEVLVQRVLQRSPSLDYWESGMDLGLSRDMFTSFLKFQKLMQVEFKRMQKVYGFDIVNGNRPVERIALELRKKVERVLEGFEHGEGEGLVGQGDGDGRGEGRRPDRVSGDGEGDRAGAGGAQGGDDRGPRSPAPDPAGGRG
jgi:dTMP kinase